MAECSENTGERNSIILEAERKNELVESEGDRQNTGNKNGREEAFEVARFLHGYVGKETEYEEVEKAEQLLEGFVGSDGIGECRGAPEEKDEKGQEERKAEEGRSLERQNECTEQSDADADQLRKRQRQIEQAKGEILRRVVQGHPGDDQETQEKEGILYEEYAGGDAENDRYRKEQGNMKEGRKSQADGEQPESEKPQERFF